MNSINFYGYKLENMSDNLFDFLMETIKEEIKDYKEEHEKYPEQVHVYECWFEYSKSNYPETDLVIYH
jgi:hypothetical protein